MKKETKHIIRTLGTILFILYVLALIYFLFFSEEPVSIRSKHRKSEAMKAISLYYGFKSNEMIYVGDAVSDIEACYSVKIQCLSAAWAASTDCEQLEKYNSGYVFSSVRLLRDFLLC